MEPDDDIAEAAAAEVLAPDLIPLPPPRLLFQSTPLRAQLPAPSGMASLDRPHGPPQTTHQWEPSAGPQAKEREEAGGVPH